MPISTSSQPSYIATRELTAVDSSQASFTIRIAIGLPYETEQGNWRCPLALDGLHSPLKGAVGIDAFQALMLTQQLARTLLSAFVERGGRFLYGPSGEEVSVQSLFDSGVLS
jgi:hypothetical protein